MPLSLVASASLIRASILLVAISFGMDRFGGPKRSSVPRVSLISKQLLHVLQGILDKVLEVTKEFI